MPRPADSSSPGTGRPRACSVRVFFSYGSAPSPSGLGRGVSRRGPLPFNGLFARGPDGQPQRVQPDEAFRVLLTVDIVLLESGHVESVEGARRAASGDPTRTLVELDAGGARDVLLRVIHGGLEHLTLRRVPVPVVHHLRIAGNQGVPQVQYLAIERERLDGAMRDVQDRRAWGFIHAARLHGDAAGL